MTRLSVETLRAGEHAWARAGKDAGSITVFVVSLALSLVLVAGLVFDAGGALTDRQRAADVAEQAARAGSDRLLPTGAGRTPLIDVPAARATALAFLHREGVDGTVQASPTQVTVNVTIHHHTALLQAAGITTLTITGTATAVPLPGLKTAAGSDQAGHGG
jgi:Flp pilus assembly protein TadG